MRRVNRAVAAEAMAGALHDLSQPLGAAALCTDAAALRLARGETELCRESIEAASTGLDRALLLLRLLKVANGGEPGHRVESFDPADVFNAIGQDLNIPTLGTMVVDRSFFEAALTGLMRTLAPIGGRTRLGRRTREGSLPVILQGPGGCLGLLRFWADALRRVGVAARCRTGDAGFEVTLRLPLLPAHADRGRRR